MPWEVIGSSLVDWAPIGTFEAVSKSGTVNTCMWLSTRASDHNETPNTGRSHHIVTHALWPSGTPRGCTCSGLPLMSPWGKTTD